MTYTKVAIIILNWNSKEDTIERLESLKHITYPNYELLLVDNGSTDGLVECFRERYPRMKIIENGENLGIRRAMGIGVYSMLVGCGSDVEVFNSFFRMISREKATMVD